MKKKAETFRVWTNGYPRGGLPPRSVGVTVDEDLDAVEDRTLVRMHLIELFARLWQIEPAAVFASHEAPLRPE